MIFATLRLLRYKGLVYNIICKRYLIRGLENYTLYQILITTSLPDTTSLYLSLSFGIVLQL